MKRFALLALMATPAFAQLPLSVSKSFTPAVVDVNQTSILTITIANPNAGPITGVSVNDLFPIGLTTAGAVSTTCGGFLSVGSTSLFLSGGTVAGHGSCVVTAPVHAAVTGKYENFTGAVFSTAPPSLGGASATLQVVSGTVPMFSRAALLLLAAMLAAVAISRR